MFNKNKIILPDENGVEQNVFIKKVTSFSGNLGNKNIEIFFDTIQGLSSKINEPQENTIEIRDFEKNKIVLLADEAHHLNADTKKKTEIENEKTWEQTI